jgi:MoxR-like ATPase
MTVPSPLKLDELKEVILEENQKFKKASEEIGKVIVGQKELVNRLLIALLADGHLLLEGLPGLAKTLAVTTLAKVIQASFKRIQFTPDLLPADLTGTTIYNPNEGTFSVKKGPIFTNLILADEINRAPAKVQSALLEAMGERQVTIGNETFLLEKPFLVIATQNPIEHEGTYRLPEAQTDRFMMKVKIDYPTKEEEREIMSRMAQLKKPPAPPALLSSEEILNARKVVDQVYMDEKVYDYIIDIVFATRYPERAGAGFRFQKLLDFGASPRASIYLVLAGKAHAFLEGRAYVTPHDIKSVGHDVLRHRLLCSYEAEAEGMTSDDVIDQIFKSLPVP